MAAPEPDRSCRAGFTPADGGGNAAWVWDAHSAGRHEAGPTGLLWPRRSLIAPVGPALRRPTAVGTMPECRRIKSPRPSPDTHRSLAVAPSDTRFPARE